VNDETTAALIGSFYKLLSSGHDPAAALRQAKLNWLAQNDGQPFHKLPYYWAGMIYYGDNEPVTVNRQSHFSKYRWVAVLIVAGLISFFITRKKR
jgi:hypothetical protein